MSGADTLLPATLSALPVDVVAGPGGNLCVYRVHL